MSLGRGVLGMLGRIFSGLSYRPLGGTTRAKVRPQTLEATRDTTSRGQGPGRASRDKILGPGNDPRGVRPIERDGRSARPIGCGKMYYLADYVGLLNK